MARTRIRLQLALRVGCSLCVLAAFVEVLCAAPIDHYICRRNITCKNASVPCWGATHPWGSTVCAVCNGSGSGDLCVRDQLPSTCLYLGINLSCGTQVKGTCAGGPVGTCTGTIPTSILCSIPKC